MQVEPEIKVPDDKCCFPRPDFATVQRAVHDSGFRVQGLGLDASLAPILQRYSALCKTQGLGFRVQGLMRKVSELRSPRKIMDYGIWLWVEG